MRGAEVGRRSGVRLLLDHAGSPVQSRSPSVTAGIVVAFAAALSGASVAQSAPTFMGLGDLPGGSFSSQALGVSADGSVVIGAGSSASGTEAFRWTSGGGMVGLGDLPGGPYFSLPYGVSADGSVVVGRGFSASGIEAFRWTSGGGMVGLGDFPGGSFSSEAPFAPRRVRREWPRPDRTRSESAPRYPFP
jgi:probable HAF family extracellular repeat protein